MIEKLIGSRSADDWLYALPKYSAKSINALLESGQSEEKILEIWLSSPGNSITAGFGGNIAENGFFANFKGEFRKFSCGDPAYEKLRSELSDAAGQSALYIVGVIAAAIGSSMGVAMGVLVPGVVLMLRILGKVGVASWCESAA